MFNKVKEFVKKYPETIPVALMAGVAIYQAGKIQKLSYALGVSDHVVNWVALSVKSGCKISIDENGNFVALDCPQIEQAV